MIQSWDNSVALCVRHFQDDQEHANLVSFECVKGRFFPPGISLGLYTCEAQVMVPKLKACWYIGLRIRLSRWTIFGNSCHFRMESESKYRAMLPHSLPPEAWVFVPPKCPVSSYENSFLQFGSSETCKVAILYSQFGFLAQTSQFWGNHSALNGVGWNPF